MTSRRGSRSTSATPTSASTRSCSASKRCGRCDRACSRSRPRTTSSRPPTSTTRSIRRSATCIPTTRRCRRRSRASTSRRRGRSGAARCPKTPQVAETLEIPPALYCAVMCVEPEPIDPLDEPVRVPHRHAAVVLRMARARVLGRGRAAERLYLQSGAIVLGALLTWSSSSTTRCVRARATAGALPSHPRPRGDDRARRRPLPRGAAAVPRSTGTRSARSPPTRRRSAEEPYWMNGFIPGLDGVALYSFVADQRPAQLPRGRIGQLDEVRAPSGPRSRPVDARACRSTRFREPRSTSCATRSMRLPVEDVDLASVRPARRRRRALRRQLASRVSELRRDGDAHRGHPLASRGRAGRHPRHLPARGLPAPVGRPVLLRAVPARGLAARWRRRLRDRAARLTTSAVSPSSITLCDPIWSSPALAERRSATAVRSGSAPARRVPRQDPERLDDDGIARDRDRLIAESRAPLLESRRTTGSHRPR